MSLRTRTSPLPRSRGRASVRASRSHAFRSRGRTGCLRPGGWPSRLVSLRRCEQPNAQNSGGWFVAGASGDIGRKESVTRTIAGREVVFWRNSDRRTGRRARARARTSGRCWTSAR